MQASDGDRQPRANNEVLQFAYACRCRHNTHLGSRAPDRPRAAAAAPLPSTTGRRIVGGRRVRPSIQTRDRTSHTRNCRPHRVAVALCGRLGTAQSTCRKRGRGHHFGYSTAAEQTAAAQSIQNRARRLRGVAPAEAGLQVRLPNRRTPSRASWRQTVRGPCPSTRPRVPRTNRNATCPCRRSACGRPRRRSTQNGGCNAHRRICRRCSPPAAPCAPRRSERYKSYKESCRPPAPCQVQDSDAGASKQVRCGVCGAWRGSHS